MFSSEPYRLRVPGDWQVWIDREDLDKVLEYGWFVECRDFTGGRKPHRVRANRFNGASNSPITLHRLILSFPDELIDHINRNPLDNRKSNLRLANKQINRVNTDPNGNRNYKGAMRVERKSGPKWESRIWNGSQALYLGTFDTEEEAARSYDRMAIELWGDKARLNINGNEQQKYMEN